MKLIGRLWHGWKRFGKKVGDFQARLLLSIFYFVILSPFAFIMRFADPLGLRKSGGEPRWQPRASVPEGDVLTHARRQS